MWYAGVAVVVGLLVIGAGIGMRRYTDRDVRTALVVVLAGLMIVTWGGDGLVQFSAVGIPAVQYRPQLSQIYPALDIGLGLAFVLGSLGIGVWRWPERPRYAFLGVLVGAWIFYPAIFGDVAGVSISSPGYDLGVAIVFAVPLLLGYILWRDAGSTLRRALAFPTARWVGAATTAIASAYFAFSTGMVSNIPDHSSTHTLSWTHFQSAVTPLSGPVIEWPAVVFWSPHLELTGFVSVGMVVLVGTLSVLLGLLGALTSAAWLSAHGRDGLSGTLGGLGALAGPNACCCCGPIIPQIAVLLLGPSAASPTFWLFVQPTSPIGTSFLAASLLLMTGSLLSLE